MNRVMIAKAVEQWAAAYLISPPELAHGTTTNAEIMMARQAVMTGIADAIEACNLESSRCGDAGPASFTRRLQGPIAQVQALLQTLDSQVTAAHMSANYEQLTDAVQRLVECDPTETAMLLAEVCWAGGIRQTFTT